MVDHQAPRHHLDLVLLGALSQAPQKELAIRVIEKHRLAVIPPLRDVMRQSRDDKTWHFGHAIKCVPAAFISSQNETFHSGTIIRLRPYFWRSTEMISSAVI